MIRRGWLGEKSGRGFYQRVKKGADTEILTLDPATMEYRPAAKGALCFAGNGSHHRRYSRASAAPFWRP